MYFLSMSAGISNFFDSKCCSPSMCAGVGSGLLLGSKGKAINGFNRMQWKTGWIRLRVFGISNCTVAGLMILIMGKGLMCFGPSFFKGSLEEK